MAPPCLGPERAWATADGLVQAAELCWIVDVSVENCVHFASTTCAQCSQPAHVVQQRCTASTNPARKNARVRNACVIQAYVYAHVYGAQRPFCAAEDTVYTCGRWSQLFTATGRPARIRCITLQMPCTCASAPHAQNSAREEGVAQGGGSSCSFSGHCCCCCCGQTLHFRPRLRPVASARLFSDIMAVGQPPTSISWDIQVRCAVCWLCSLPRSDRAGGVGLERLMKCAGCA